MFVADVVRGSLGVRVVLPTDGFSPHIMFGAGRQSCEPAVFVDGRFRPEGSSNLDAIVDVDDVRAVEVYRRGVDVPSQFVVTSDCGAILIWRGNGRRPQPQAPLR